VRQPFAAFGSGRNKPSRAKGEIRSRVASKSLLGSVSGLGASFGLRSSALLAVQFCRQPLPGMNSRLPDFVLHPANPPRATAAMNANTIASFRMAPS
jgi:hypothetical protein